MSDYTHWFQATASWWRFHELKANAGYDDLCRFLRRAQPVVYWGA